MKKIHPYHLSSLIVLVCVLVTFSSTVYGWTEHVGSGSVNGMPFPIAVVRNAGSNEQFLATLKGRFGPSAHVHSVQTPTGVQFFVQQFDPQTLALLPLDKKSSALEQYILDNTMVFTLFHLDGDGHSAAESNFAVGSPMAVFAMALPGDIKSEEFSFLRGKVKKATEISFKFGTVEINSLHGTIVGDVNDVRVEVREALAAAGLKAAGQRSEQNAFRSGDSYEFYMDGKSQVANFALLEQSATKEVTINVNQIKIH